MKQVLYDPRCFQLRYRFFLRRYVVVIQRNLDGRRYVVASLFGLPWVEYVVNLFVAIGGSEVDAVSTYDLDGKTMFCFV